MVILSRIYDPFVFAAGIAYTHFYYEYNFKNCLVMENIRGLSINYDKNYHNIKKPSLNVIGNLIDTLKIKVIKFNLIYDSV
jgi:hypothetical protein